MTMPFMLNAFNRQADYPPKAPSRQHQLMSGLSSIFSYRSIYCRAVLA